ncbi:MAG: phosphate acyltransferase PlsX, partial [Acidimicrobiales bacterium]
GNVVLKALEGAMHFMRDAVFGVLSATPEAAAVGAAAMPLLLPLVREMDPESYGGAVLLGVDGVCIISHGASSSRAVVNAIGVAAEMVERGLVDRLRQALKT